MKCFTSVLAEKFGLAKDRFPATPQENALAEEALAAELGKLSLDEHEKIIFDVHGMHTIDDEDPKSVGTYLEELEKELRKIPEKPAYEQALYLNEEYVRSESFRLMFLRGNRFDAADAAEAMVHHFQNKLDVFGGGDILGRDVKLSDLNADDMACLEAGNFQVLANRDGAGRAVVFIAPGYKPKCEMEAMYRAHWYLFCSILRDEDTQKKGIVCLIYNVGKYGSEENFAFMNKFQDIHLALPIKAVANHFCYDKESTRRFLTGMQLFMPEDERNRTRPHFSSNAKEILFELQTYSIPTDDFPINVEETLELGWHKEWIETQRARESKNGPSKAGENIIVPRRFDVLFGRGRTTRNHTGNLRAAHLVEMFQARYENANKFQKTEVAERIVAMIHESYGRFLKWEEGGWVEVEYDSAREKVSHFFRHLRSRKTATQNGENASVSSDDSGSSDGKRRKETRKTTSKSAPQSKQKKRNSLKKLGGIMRQSSRPNTLAAPAQVPAC